MGPNKSFTGLEIRPTYDEKSLSLEEIRRNNPFVAKIVKYFDRNVPGMGPASGKLYQNSTKISAEPPLKLGLPNLYLQAKYIKIDLVVTQGPLKFPQQPE